VSRSPYLALLALLVGMQAGCIFGGGSSTHSPAGGDLAVDWTIAGGTHEVDCVLTRSTSARIEIFDSNNVKSNHGADTQDCAAFQTSFGFLFYPGNYTVEVTMLHGDGTPSTTTAQAQVAVFSGETTVVPFDFSPASFF
jgi:hypothetical protein